VFAEELKASASMRRNAEAAATTASAECATAVSALKTADAAFLAARRNGDELREMVQKTASGAGPRGETEALRARRNPQPYCPGPFFRRACGFGRSGGFEASPS
jgi:hypothetical protein